MIYDYDEITKKVREEKNIYYIYKYRIIFLNLKKKNVTELTIHPRFTIKINFLSIY